MGRPQRSGRVAALEGKRPAMAPMRGEFYDGKQEAYLTPGLLGGLQAGDPMYPVPTPAQNSYTVTAKGMLAAQQLHPTTYSTAEYAPPTAPAGVNSDEVESLLAGIDQLEARVAALEGKRPASSAYPVPATVLKKLGPIKALLWDMDGVLADVSQSYRTAIIMAAKKFGVAITGADINVAKAAGNANNDWVLTRKLVADKMAAEGKKASQVPSLEAVTEAFEAVYQGGLWKTESLLVDRELIAALAARYPMAIVTGRPRKPDAERFLEHYRLTEFFSHMVCMGETPLPKPDPAPCTVMLKALGVPAGSNVIMIGDTVDDIRSAIGAKCSGVGVPAPGHDVAEDTKLLHSVGAVTVLSQGLPELKLLVDGVPAQPAASTVPRYPWHVKIQASPGGKRPWTVRILPKTASAGGDGGDADRLAALLAGIEECEQRLKTLEMNPPKQQSGGAAASTAGSSEPATPGFFPTDMQWLRFGGQAGSTGFTVGTTYTPPSPKPAPAPAPAASDTTKTQSKQPAAKAPKQKQEKKVKKQWTPEEQAAARAKVAGGSDKAMPNDSAKPKEKKAAPKNDQAAKQPEPTPVDDTPMAAQSGADTVASVEGYYYAGYGIWALRSGASPSVPSVLPAPRQAAPEHPLRDGRGGPKAEPAAAANEYVAIETQGKPAAAPAPASAPAPAKQKQAQKHKQKAQSKKAVGEPVEEMSDADMLRQLHTTTTTTTTTSSSAAPVPSAAPEQPPGDSASEEWVMVDEGDAEKKSPLPIDLLENFKSTCLAIICQFIKDRGHKVPEVRITWGDDAPTVSRVLMTALESLMRAHACVTGARQKAHGQAGTQEAVRSAGAKIPRARPTHGAGRGILVV